MTFTFKLKRPDGAPADPPTIRLGVYNWKPGDVITRGSGSLRVVGVRDEGDEEATVLVVEDVSG